jgi:hypothetical protein
MSGGEPLDLPLKSRAYHVVRFGGNVEARAFAAALRRILNGPRGREFLGASESAEIWLSPSEPVEIYLSSSALEAARAVFSPVPIEGTRFGRDLPAGCIAMTVESLDSPS